jgi:TfoX/Sxy family transcriptional regulator of competence genes
MQNLYNLLYREEEREMIPLCVSEGVAIIPWSPTAAGILTGKYFEGGRIVTSEKDSGRVSPGSVSYDRYVGRPGNDEIVKRAKETASNKGATPAQVAIAWLLHRGVTAPIVGTAKVEHLEEFVGSTSRRQSRGTSDMKVPRPDSEDKAFFQSVLPKDERVKVKGMFGNDAAFVNGNLFAGLFGKDLFVRLSEEDQALLLREKGSSKFAPMAGRPMSGYVVVPGGWRGEPKKAASWVVRSLEWASGLPAKEPKKAKK